MITVHVSPSEEKIYIEHTTHGTLIISPEEAWSIYQRLHERRSDIYGLVRRRETATEQMEKDE
jgi:hypothetical protein